MAALAEDRVVGLIMAGGLGTRMLSSGVELPKPLVPVRGTPLLEHNVRLLLLRGVRELVVSLSSEPSGDRVRHFCEQILVPVVEEAGGRLELMVERRPLGNIGCAGQLAGLTSAAVVVYADNLTTLDVGEVLAAHVSAHADLTLAWHEQPFTIPYGRLAVEGDRVTGYREKPTVSVPVASAVSVLGRRALDALPTDRPTGMVDLANSLIANGGHVAPYRHQAPWVDVNDASNLAAAEQLVDVYRSHVGW